jgi:hypothetical protein
MTPIQHNGPSIYKPIEKFYLHADSSDYGWGEVLNENLSFQALGFWYDTYRTQHTTWKEPRAVRHLIESFLPLLRGRNVLHEDDTAVVATLTKLIIRSSVMMTNLRHLWYMMDTNDIRIPPCYIRSSPNIWVD